MQKVARSILNVWDNVAEWMNDDNQLKAIGIFAVFTISFLYAINGGQ